jgi:hypothetical protein
MSFEYAIMYIPVKYIITPGNNNHSEAIADMITNTLVINVYVPNFSKLILFNILYIIFFICYNITLYVRAV